jgi:lysophospholipase L1-like esterase
MSKTVEVLYLADFNRPTFEQDRLSVDAVCAGDSITGWNNFGPARSWPFPTYPRFLQELCQPMCLRVADGGIAGEVSDNGLGHVRRYLRLFPNSRYFVIGFGTNDLGMWPDLDSTSRRIIENLGRMVQAVRDEGKQPILFNVPYANELRFAPHIARDTHEKRDFHNGRLFDYCQRSEVPLADICSHLRDEHLGDELHPNQAGAKMIAEKVFAGDGPFVGMNSAAGDRGGKR